MVVDKKSTRKSQDPDPDKKSSRKSQDPDSDQEMESPDSSADESETTTTEKEKPSSKKATKFQKKLDYKFAGYWKEDHKSELFGVSVNQHISDAVVFATAGSNRVTVYEVMGADDVKLCQCYVDPDADENFYTCAWSYDKASGKPILAAAGKRGVVRVFSTATMTSFMHLIGHGNSVNELRFHPVDPNLLLSVSKDHALRLWNVSTGYNIAIFGGVEGHRDEVLSADFDMLGAKIVSCGMDHSLKVWKIDGEVIQSAIARSYDKKTYGFHTGKPFDTEMCHFPDFSTRDIHKNYVDCCRWLGNMVLSKSCENSISCWKPGTAEDKAYQLCKFKYKDASENKIWFIRFSLDLAMKTMAIGNSKGKTFVWDLTGEDPEAIKPTMLSHPKCNAIVRQTGLSRDGKIIICVCDDATIWRWDRVQSK